MLSNLFMTKVTFYDNFEVFPAKKSIRILFTTYKKHLFYMLRHGIIAEF